MTNKAIIACFTRFLSSLKLDGRTEGVVDSREKLLEFCFDYCYWSVDPADAHYASQEEVMTELPNSLCVHELHCPLINRTMNKTVFLFSGFV